MNIFDTHADVEITEDSDHVGYRAKESDIYPATIKTAYLTTNPTSGSATLVVHFNVKPESGEAFEHVERECVISGKTKGDFYVKDGKKFILPGKQKMNTLCQILVGQDLAAMAKAGGVETKSHTIRSNGKDTIEALPTLTAWQGLDLHVGIQKQLQNKQVKQGNTYVDTAEIRETNVVDKFFDGSLRTWTEIKEDKPAAHYEAWLKQFKGKTIDKSKPVEAKPLATNQPTSQLNLNL